MKTGVKHVEYSDIVNSEKVSRNWSSGVLKNIEFGCD